MHAQQQAQMLTSYDRIPEELKWTAQWCIAGLTDTGKYRAPYFATAYGLWNASPTNPETWTDFESVCEYAETHSPHGIGFVLSASDPFVCIDLDVKNAANEPDQALWTTQQELDRYQKIIAAFGSYTEISASGHGYHVWVRGSIGKGVRRGRVEVYSQERFIVCTGNVFLDAPIQQNQELLDILVAEMRRGEAPILTLVDNEQTESDEVIMMRACKAENNAKFIALCEGDWANMGYPSQSEADISLLTMLAFYTKSNTQVLRLFRLTNLGKREKAVKNDYYLLTTLKKVRSIAANEDQSSQMGSRIAGDLMARLQAVQAAQVQPATVAPPIQANPAQPLPAAPVLPDFATNRPPHTPPPPSVFPEISNVKPIEYPPGVVGKVAEFIFNSSPRPIKEVSIVSALGLFSGICGRAYSIPQSGLNLYIILVGQSAIGKEAMHSGMSAVVNRISNGCAFVGQFVDFSNYVSGPALTKAVLAKTSFVNITGEFGRKLKKMAADDSDSVAQGLRTTMLDLYQKSGSHSIVGGLGYSDQEKNVGSASGVAYSMIGETTPGTLYESLTDTMMADGFLSRFTIVEFMGQRPVKNRGFEKKQMDLDLVQQLQSLCTTADQINRTPTSCAVQFDQEAEDFLDKFDTHCDNEINKTMNEGWRQMWNRAHLKVLRISALLGSADNHMFPTVRLEHVMWAYDLIMRDINIMTRRIDSGDVGSSDNTRESKILTLCKQYLTNELSNSYGIPAEMHAAGVVPRKYLQINTQRTSAFTSHKLGQITSMDMTIRSLVDGGYLLEVPKPEAIQKFAFHGKCYRVLSLPISNNEHKNIAQFSALNHG